MADVSALVATLIACQGNGHTLLLIYIVECRRREQSVGTCTAFRREARDRR